MKQANSQKSSRQKAEMMNINQHQQTKQDIKKSGERFLSFMEQTDEGFFLFETDTPIVYSIQLRLSNVIMPKHECMDSQMQKN